MRIACDRNKIISDIMAMPCSDCYTGRPCNGRQICIRNFNIADSSCEIAVTGMNIRKRTAADGSRNRASGNGRILCAGNMNASYIAFGVVTTTDAGCVYTARHC